MCRALRETAVGPGGKKKGNWNSQLHVMAAAATMLLPKSIPSHCKAQCDAREGQVGAMQVQTAGGMCWEMVHGQPAQPV